MGGLLSVVCMMNLCVLMGCMCKCGCCSSSVWWLVGKRLRLCECVGVV